MSAGALREVVADTTEQLAILVGEVGVRVWWTGQNVVDACLSREQLGASYGGCLTRLLGPSQNMRRHRVAFVSPPRE